jgi:hypothetical protein
MEEEGDREKVKRGGNGLREVVVDIIVGLSSRE